MFQSRKAISPILATLLLIVIAVAAIVVTYAWVMTYISSTTSQAGIMLSEDNTSWPSAGKIVITVRNTGTSDATLDKIYIGANENNLTPINSTDVTYDPTSQIVSKNGGTITITVTYSWNSTTTYYFKIAPLTGSPLGPYQEKSP